MGLPSTVPAEPSLSTISAKATDVQEKPSWTPSTPFPPYLFCCCCCSVTSVVSDSVRPHRRQPTRLPRPWDSPGKNIGVGCHFLLQCMKMKSESEVAQSCPTLSDPMDCSLPGSPSTGFSRQEYWSGVQLPSPIDTSSVITK